MATGRSRSPSNRHKLTVFASGARTAKWVRSAAGWAPSVPGETGGQKNSPTLARSRPNAPLT
jgi:hypothetical protein